MRNRMVAAVALGMLGALQAEPRREDELKGAKLDELELGPSGIQRKAPAPEVRREAPPPPGRFNQAVFDRITGRSDADVAERLQKQAAKLARRAMRAGHAVDE